MGYIYLIKEREFLHDSIVKVCQIQNYNNIIKRHPKWSKLLYVIHVEDSYKILHLLIDEMKYKFNHKTFEYGYKYFNGDCNEMITFINESINGIVYNGDYVSPNKRKKYH